MKKKSIILLAFALLAMMTQCKKENEQIIPDNTGNTVAITLSISNGNSKVDVNPSTGTVNFESGDIIYVGSGGKYVGMLTHNGAGHFVGNITNPTEGQPLYFYFLGNVTPQETLGPGSTEECSVVISDQTQHLPVISCAPSNEEYAPATTSYTAKLKNKCALVKFNVTTFSTSPVYVTGMYNKVTVDFTNNTLAYSQDGDGTLMLPAGPGQGVEKWAIVLPQPALAEGEEGSVRSAFYTGVRPSISEVLVNAYWPEGITLDVTTAPVGALKSLFTINNLGTQVLFSQGNLQYMGSAATPYWQFAEHQYDYMGSNSGQNSNSQTVDRDMFGWGTSGYNHGAICYQPWSTSMNYSDYYAYGQYTYNLYDQTGQADWGYNAIVNGGNTENSGWRTLTKDEWKFVFSTRADAASKYGYGNVNGVNGMILLPDAWTLPEGLSFTAGNSSNWANVYNLDQWTQMETAGAVFLPAAGYRYGDNFYDVGSGNYWSASYDSNQRAYLVEFGINSNTNNSVIETETGGSRTSGRFVRLVRDVQ